MRENDLNNLSRTEICLWLDFYGVLLTSHTRDVLELHYAEDMSLSEIALNLGITRQAVHDRIRQGVGNLGEYEEKMGLVSRFRNQKECITMAIQAIEAGEVEQARERLLQLIGLL
jgi:predicted DNA-binding protein YlxM (UPF0122 family)